MTSSNSITTPIAICKKNSANLNLPWFLQRTEYHPVPATFRPLVNGERAFGALYKSIMAAKVSIDYVCWGFQPSMYFKRTGSAGELCIGDLLIKKGLEGVKVRILCWYDKTHVAQTQENPTPGNNTISYFEKGKQNRNDAQEDYDKQWYGKVKQLNKTNQGMLERVALEKMRIPSRDESSYLKNIEFATRDFNAKDRAEIIWQLAIHSTDKKNTTNNKLQSTAVMAAWPTHHQKVVLVDYEKPERAVGFVMGHNTLDAYWDKDRHSYVRMHARFGRNGATPRQDISSMVTGPILEHLNHNFCDAWKRQTSIDLLLSRKALAAELRLNSVAGTPVMAQILRTQSQEGVHDIKQLYLNAVNNVTSYIYLENQYFRWEPLAAAIKKSVQDQIKGGRDPDKHGAVHLFVVTNSNDEGIGPGTMNTYRMLDSLGKKNVLPSVSRIERNEALDHELEAAKIETINARQSLARLSDPRMRLSPTALEKLKADRQAKLDEAQEHQEKLEHAMPSAKEENIVPIPIRGLKIHICTLVAPDSPPGNWMPVYIHSKLAIIDDVFTTLGSANINIRSMEVDSELNICHEHPGLSKKLRQELWNIHTDNKGGQDDVAVAFSKWLDMLEENNNRREGNNDPEVKEKLSPIVSLVEFYRDSDARTNMD
ncbi:phospholipase D-like domain-containing protein [Pseudomonas sp. KU26590]|uniref:phospholipase D-like domain-containing protein n=1 Tax=Pseudomonas sp. KU26590 TaxID=2991051 RepID=UPI00223E4F4D|nr:phospholipase D-like domain-containing protein [Pseudomonas sp. KU26590]UZJ58432.1 phospholipase D-like domain-containing protein [Pseudomonas sp. KU26590]